jgi:hypothetical protein
VIGSATTLTYTSNDRGGTITHNAQADYLDDRPHSRSGSGAASAVGRCSLLGGHPRCWSSTASPKRRIRRLHLVTPPIPRPACRCRRPRAEQVVWLGPLQTYPGRSAPADIPRYRHALPMIPSAKKAAYASSTTTPWSVRQQGQHVTSTKACPEPVGGRSHDWSVGDVTDLPGRRGVGPRDRLTAA